MSIEIVEVLGRSNQGTTRPFICRGDDGHTYFVKGNDAGRRSLICEWLAGRMAQTLGLPIASFAQVIVPEELISAGATSNMRELGAGIAFGSRKLAVNELTVSSLNGIPDEQQRDVLVLIAG